MLKICNSCLLEKDYQEFELTYKKEGARRKKCKDCRLVEVRERTGRVPRWNPYKEDGKKACSSCKRVIGFSNFFRNGKHKYHSKCKDCTRKTLGQQKRPTIYYSNGKICASCKILKSEEDYYKSKVKLKAYCKECAFYKRIEKVYGLSKADYSEILLSQGYKCSVCFRDLKGSKKLAHIDHCHKTGKVRGILCLWCNTGIGFFNESIEVLSCAIDYLKKSSKTVNIPLDFKVIEASLYSTLGLEEKVKYSNLKSKLKTRFSLTVFEYLVLMETKKCEICNKEFSNKFRDKANIDHCHITGNIRGLLCRKCNSGIGRFKDDVSIIYNAIDYLHRNY